MELEKHSEARNLQGSVAGQTSFVRPQPSVAIVYALPLQIPPCWCSPYLKQHPRASRNPTPDKNYENHTSPEGHPGLSVRNQRKTYARSSKYSARLQHMPVVSWSGTGTEMNASVHRSKAADLSVGKPLAGDACLLPQFPGVCSTSPLN